MIAQIAVPRPFDKLLDYTIPPGMESVVQVGSRVRVPLGETEEAGYVIQLQAKSNLPRHRLKSITKVLEPYPVFDEALLSLCAWMKEFYLCSLGETLHAAAPPLPTRARPRISNTPYFEREGSRPETLTSAQSAALEEIRSWLGKGHTVSLLWGITASGKTEVYLQAIEHALSMGLGAICLVPEIALTPQTLARFRGRFGDQVALMHSKLSTGERYQAWLSVKKKEQRIVLGTRSAIFAPVDPLGLIIIDEEHEPSYRQEDTPRYHAREVSVYRAQKCGAVVLLGSATPDLRTYHHTTRHRCRLLSLPERVDGHQLPEVKVVDMRLQEEREGRRILLSGPLLAAMERRLVRKEQIILFLNRKGYATFVLCRRCGEVLKCHHCSVSLTYHTDTDRMHCHHCNEQTPKLQRCPSCQSEKIGYLGGGTQKVESVVQDIFPEITVARMDADSTSQKGSHHRILDAFGRGEIQVLVGTQMIAKGLDFPRVTLVGIVIADMGLNWPHFRSSERTFQLLTQVAGRAGRGDQSGEVIVQSYNPGHYAIQCARKQDYISFYRREIEFRRALGYPPFRHLLSAVFTSSQPEKAQEAAQKVAERMAEEMAPPEHCLEILGPAPAVIEKIMGEYIWELTVLCRSHGWLREKISAILREVGMVAGVKVMIDS